MPLNNQRKKRYENKNGKNQTQRHVLFSPIKLLFSYFDGKLGAMLEMDGGTGLNNDPKSAIIYIYEIVPIIIFTLTIVSL